MPLTEYPVEDLESDIKTAIRNSTALLKELVAKPKHLPGDRFYDQIAQAIIEQMKRAGVVKIVRQQTGSHQYPPPRKP